jgi:hypothetical protein
MAYHRQLVSELDITGGDKGKTGYYAGIIVRTFHFSNSLDINREIREKLTQRI